MPRCLRIIKVVPRDVGNRMKKIRLLSRSCLRHCQEVINAVTSQEDTTYVDETLRKLDVMSCTSMLHTHYYYFLSSSFNLVYVIN